MRTAASKSFVALVRGGHTYVIFFDEASQEALYDHVLDLAEDTEMSFTWQDAFGVIDCVSQRTRWRERNTASTR